MSATIDLGKIKITWRGTYNASTAYVVDDAVYYSGSSWINKQAGTGQTPSNGSAYWDKMSQGSDLGSISGLAQGDIIYYNGSDFARLAAGTAGKFLKSQGSGANPIFDDSGGGVIAVSHKAYGGTNSINTQNRTSDFTFTGNSYEISQLTLSMTPSATSSKFLMQMNLQASHSDPHMGMGWITYQVSGGTEYAITSSGTRGITFRYDNDSVSSSNAGNPSIAHQVMIAPNTTSAVTFRIRLATPNSSYPWYINRDPNGSTDVDDGGFMLSTFTVFELDGSKSTKGSTTENETKT